MPTSYFNLISAQRYYHMVAFKYSQHYSFLSYLKDVGFRRSKEHSSALDYAEFEIQHLRVLSNVRYHVGRRDYSMNGDDQPPYYYDHFAINLKKQNIILMAFPFRKMGEDTIERLIGRKAMLANGKFLRPLLTKLLKNSNGQDFVEDDEGYMSSFSSIELKLIGNKDIDLVKIEGPTPLNSDIYRDIFKKLVDEDEGKLAQCSLKMATTTGEGDDERKTKASIHLDHFGNYKLYLQASGRNILSMPYLFKLLRKYKCLEETSVNPIIKIQDEQP